MKLRTPVSLFALCATLAGITGCHRNIVSAAPASVTAPPPTAPMPQPMPAPPTSTANAVPAPEPGPVPMPPAPPLTPPPQPPRPAPVEPEPAKPAPAPEPPQISPAMTSAQLAEVQRRTTSDITVAEKNLQISYAKQLNASQNDLVDKIRGFLAQAHEAVRANDWVLARNLAQKAQVLSVELVKSF